MEYNNLNADEKEALNSILKNILFPSIANSVSKEVKDMKNVVKQAFYIASSALDIATFAKKFSK